MSILSPGERVGPYQIIEQVGKGGMATVFKAYHAAMDRHVAIKILPFQFAEDPEFLSRFKREVHTIARLEHPRILPVYDSGEHNGTPFLVMRFLDSGTLKDRLQRGRFTMAEADAVFTQLAEALGHAHQFGIIHRDLKPANVLLTERGDVFLSDFGIAKLVGETTHLTQSGAITGTPAYMSPEQAQGESLDARSDIYSLGIVLYEMLTGRVPFEADTPLAVILKHLQAPLPPPTSVNPSLSPAIEKFVLKCLAKNPNDRYQNTAELIAAWKLAIAGGSGVSMEELDTVTVAVAKTSRGSRAYWLAGGLLGLALLVWGGNTLLKTCCAPPIPTATTLPSATPEPTEVLGGAPTPASSPTPTPASSPTPEPTTIPAVSTPHWDAFVGTNDIYAVAYLDGHIYTGGPGGIAVWNVRDMRLERLFTYRDHLPGETIYALYADSGGNLWAGGNRGFAMFNGTQWESHGEFEGLNADDVNAFAGFGGGMALGTLYGDRTDDGVGVFDGRFYFPLAEWFADPDCTGGALSTNVNDLAVDPDGNLWAATECGLAEFNGETWNRRDVSYGLANANITSVFFDAAGNLYIGSDEGTVLVEAASRAVSALTFTETNPVYQFAQSPTGEIWMAGQSGAWRYFPELGRAEYYQGGSDHLPVYALSSVAAGEDGRMYFGSEEGLFVFVEGDGFTLYQTPNVPRQPASMWIVPAPDGTLLFLEEYSLDVDIFHPADGTWTPMRDLPCCHVPLFYDADGNLWAGGDTGLLIITADRDITLTTAAGLPSDRVYPISFAPDGRAWVGTDGGLAVIQDFAVVETYRGADIGSATDHIRAVLAASDGSIWVASGDDVLYRDPAGTWQVFNDTAPFTGNFSGAMNFAEGTDGSIWVATAGDGVWRYTGRWTQYLPTDPGVRLPSAYVTAIYVARDGSVWFGTEDGAARFDGANWEAFTTGDGLVHPYIYAIYVDEGGAVWFATKGGISRLTP
jgi:ligand-binding sensor domain-containing protein